jgi:nicotinamidase-related amidase
MPLVARDDSLLIVVDAQPGFFANRQMTDEERAAAARTVDRMAWLAGLAALLDVPAVVTEEAAARNGATEPRILDRLLPTTPVLVKPTFGLTGSAETVRQIEASGRRTAVLTGFETDVCVAQSAIGLCDRGLRVVVPEDTVYSTGEPEHFRGIARMRAAGVEIVSCKGLIFDWLEVVDFALDTIRRATDAFGPPPLRL